MVLVLNCDPFSIGELILLWALAISLHYYLIIIAYHAPSPLSSMTTNSAAISAVPSVTRCLPSSYLSSLYHHTRHQSVGTKVASAIVTHTANDIIDQSKAAADGVRSAIEFARLPDMWPDVLALLAAEDACSLTSVSRRLHGVGRQALLWQRYFADSFACEGGDLTCPRLLLARSRPTRVSHRMTSSQHGGSELTSYGMWKAATLLGDWVTPTLPGLATAFIDTTMMDATNAAPPTDTTIVAAATHLMGTATPIDNTGHGNGNSINGVGIGLGLDYDNNHYNDTITFIDGKLEQPFTDIASITSMMSQQNDSKRCSAVHILSAPTPFKLHYADAHVRLRIDNASWMTRRRTDLQRRWPITTLTRPMAIICLTMWCIAWWRSSLISPAIVIHWLLPSWSLLSHWSPIVIAMTSSMTSFTSYVTSSLVWSHVQIIIAMYIRTRVAMQLLCPALYSLMCSDFGWLCYCWLRAHPSGLRMRRDQKSLVHRHLADSLSPLVTFIPNHCWSDASAMAWSHACYQLIKDAHQLRFMVYIMIRAWLAFTAPWIEANFVVPLPLIIHS